jgi:hypothetical protein
LLLLPPPLALLLLLEQPCLAISCAAAAVQVSAALPVLDPLG